MTRSYVALSHQAVTEMANDRLAEIPQLRGREWTEWAYNRMNEVNAQWYRKLLRLRRVDQNWVLRDDTGKEDWLSQHWAIFNWHYHYAQKMAKELLLAAAIAAKANDNPMLISVADIIVLCDKR